MACSLLLLTLRSGAQSRRARTVVTSRHTATRARDLRSRPSRAARGNGDGSSPDDDRAVHAVVDRAAVAVGAPRSEAHDVAARCAIARRAEAHLAVAGDVVLRAGIAPYPPHGIAAG